MGGSSKQLCHTMDGFNILTPRPPCLRNSIIVTRPPPSYSNFLYFHEAVRIIGGVHNMPNLAYFTPNILNGSSSVFSTAEGVIMTPGNKILERIAVFSLGLFNTCNLY